MADDAGTTPEVHHASLELHENGDSGWPDFSIRAKVEGFSFDSQPVEIISAEPLQVEGGVHIVREHLRHMVAASIYCRDVKAQMLEKATDNLRTLWKDVKSLDDTPTMKAAREHLSDAGYMSMPSSWCDAHYVSGETDVELVQTGDGVRVLVAQHVSREGQAMSYSHTIAAEPGRVVELIEEAIQHASETQA